MNSLLKTAIKNVLYYSEKVARFIVFNNDYVAGDYYEISSEHLLDNGSGMIPIRILRGPYVGCVFDFNNLNFKDDSNVELDINEIVVGKYATKGFSKEEKFTKIMHGIFEDVLYDAVDTYKESREKVLSDEYDNREDYFEEPVPQRTVRKRSTTTSKTGVSRRKSTKNTNVGNSGVRKKVQQTSNKGNSRNKSRKQK